MTKILAMSVCGVFVACGAAQAETLAEAVTTGKPILELRPRIETVSQTGFHDATAFTARMRFGWETKSWRGLKALAEIEHIEAIGPQDYNSGLNYRTDYAPIGDPEVTEINRLQIAYAPVKPLTLTFGRQRIVFDDGRFVGESPWRQDGQTFDAARFDYASGKVTATYAYVGRINRNMGEEGDFDTRTHLFSAGFAPVKPLKLTGFIYAIDVTDPPSSSSRATVTRGVSLSAKTERGKWKLRGFASVADQSDYGANPDSYDLGFATIEATVSYKFANLKVAHDRLEGDGIHLFATPAASGHGQLGWSDAFNATGAKTTKDGLAAGIVSGGLAPKWKWGAFTSPTFQTLHYDFEAPRTGADLGSEWDLLAAIKIGKKWVVTAKYADYDGPDVAPAPADRTKAWLYFEYKL